MLLKDNNLCTGAAAVANIAAPRSAVATPIVRSTANLQSTAGTQHTTRQVIKNSYTFFLILGLFSKAYVMNNL